MVDKANKNAGVPQHESLYYNRSILRKGDLILTAFPGSSVVSKLIRFFEKVYSKDKEALYTHVNFLSEVDVENDKYEILDTKWKVETADLFEGYTGSPCAILRIKIAKPAEIDFAVKTIKESDEGKSYPVARLILHMFRMADNIHWNREVCSERGAKLWHLILRLYQIFVFERYYGWTPDGIYDFVKSNPEIFEVVFEGTC